MSRVNPTTLQQRRGLLLRQIGEPGAPAQERIDKDTGELPRCGRRLVGPGGTAGGAHHRVARRARCRHRAKSAGPTHGLARSPRDIASSFDLMLKKRRSAHRYLQLARSHARRAASRSMRAERMPVCVNMGGTRSKRFRTSRHAAVQFTADAARGDAPQGGSAPPCSAGWQSIHSLRWTAAYSGEVAEWLKAPHSKCGIRVTVSGVRIPPSPLKMLDFTSIYGLFSA